MSGPTGNPRAVWRGTRFVFLDVETTGLGKEAQLLELAMICGRFVKSKGFVVDRMVQRVFAFNERHWSDGGSPLFPGHRENGLYEECELSSCYAWKDDTDAKLAALVEHPTPEELQGEDGSLVSAKAVPIGRNVWTDLDHLKRELPKLAERFSHRHLDLTTLEYGGPRLFTHTTHRAMHDCVNELLALRAYVDEGRFALDERHLGEA